MGGTKAAQKIRINFVTMSDAVVFQGDWKLQTICAWECHIFFVKGKYESHIIWILQHLNQY